MGALTTGNFYPFYLVETHGPKDGQSLTEVHVGIRSRGFAPGPLNNAMRRGRLDKCFSGIKAPRPPHLAFGKS